MATLRTKVAAGGGIGAVLALSIAGAGFIGNAEGVRPQAYQDVAHIWTICVGHTGEVVIGGKDYGPVRAKMRLSLDQCNALLRQDSESARQALNSCIHVPPGHLGQNQSDALISLTINIGNRAACSSTFVRRINSGDLAGAAQAFELFQNTTVDGVRKPVLLGRRKLEAKLFLTPDAPVLGRDTTANLKHLNAEALKAAA